MTELNITNVRNLANEEADKFIEDVKNENLREFARLAFKAGYMTGHDRGSSVMLESIQKQFN